MPSTSALLWSYVLLCVIWGTTWGAIRLGLHDVPPLTGVAVRFLIAAGVLLVVAVWRKIPLGRQQRERRLWLLLSVFSFALPYSLVYWAEQWVPSGLTACLAATFPLFVAFLAHFALPGEHLTWRAFAAALLAFIGVTVIFSEDLSALAAPEARKAAAILLLSPLSSAISYVCTKKWGSGLSPFSLASVPNLLGAIWVGILATLFERNRVVTWTPLAIGSVVYLGIIGSAVTFTLWYWLLAHLRATRLATVSFVVPILAMVLGVAFFGEALTLRLLVGALMVVGGVAVTTLRRQGTASAPLPSKSSTPTESAGT